MRQAVLKQVRDADLHLLRVFMAVAECGGFAAAQERLNVASSTISTQISSLETRLGFQLCKRGRAGFSLTNEGQNVLDAAYGLFRHLDDFLATMESMKGSLVGTVAIGLLDNIAQNSNLRLSEALADLKQDQPMLSFRMVQLPPGQLETAVLKREVDIGVAWTAAKLPSLKRTKLFQEDQYIYCGRPNPLFARAPNDIKPSELESADWVRRGYRMPRDFPFSSPPVSTAVAYHMESMVHLILAGTHIGYLPDHYARHWVEEDRMRAILPKRLGHSVTFYLVTRTDAKEDRVISAATRALVRAHQA